MPLSPFQREILSIVSTNRTPESYIAGGAPITAQSDRQSGDFDIFHDRPGMVEPAALQDEKALAAHGHELKWMRQHEGIWSAEVSNASEPFRLEWARDSAYRFFPAQRDPDFGYVLHPADLMINKVITAASRREPRDLIDIQTLSKTLPVPAAIVAASAKDQGMTPGIVCEFINRFANYHQKELDAEMRGVDASALLQWIKAETRTALILAEQLDPHSLGRLYRENGKFITPEWQKLGTYEDVIEASDSGIAARAPDVDTVSMADRYRAIQSLKRDSGIR